MGDFDGVFLIVKGANSEVAHAEHTVELRVRDVYIAYVANAVVESVEQVRGDDGDDDWPARDSIFPEECWDSPKEEQDNEQCADYGENLLLRLNAHGTVASIYSHRVKGFALAVSGKYRNFSSNLRVVACESCWLLQ